MDEQVTPEAPEAAPQSQQPEKTPEQRIHDLMNPPEDQPAAEEPEATQPEAAEESPALDSEAPAKDGDSETDAESITVSSLTELMENIGADASQMYDLTIPVTINGRKQDIPLSEVKDSIRASKEAARYQEESKAARDSARQFQEQAEEAVKQQLAQAHQLAQGLDAMYLAPFSRVNWEQLRAEDPAEFAAKRQEYVDTREAVAQEKARVVQSIEQFKANADSATAQKNAELLAREQQALHEKWPEMASEKGDAERSALVEFLKSDGFTDVEIGSETDHRRLLLARDAMRYRSQAKEASATKKRVIKIGKTVLTPSATKTKAQKSASRDQPLREALRKSGKIDDAAALLYSRMNKG